MLTIKPRSLMQSNERMNTSLPTHVVDHIDALAAGEIADGSNEIPLAVDDPMIASVGGCKCGLLVAADRSPIGIR